MVPLPSKWAAVGVRSSQLAERIAHNSSSHLWTVSGLVPIEAISSDEINTPLVIAWLWGLLIHNCHDLCGKNSRNYVNAIGKLQPATDRLRDRPSDRKWNLPS